VRRAARCAGALAAVFLAAASVAHGDDSKGEPSELVRAFQSLQDQVVQGNNRAHAAQRELIARIAQRFDALSTEQWQEPKNARAAVVFVLSGGTARVLQKLMGSGAKSDLGEKLLKGSLAYGEGRQDDAAEFLGDIEARTLDPSMAGHVAYVKGELAAKKEPAKALIYLDDARLLSPGTIIEEAALRRQIALLAGTGASERYEALATRYLRRFPNSVYAGGFRQQFAVAIAVHTDASEPDRLARLETMLGGVLRDDRREVYLTIAKEAVAKGKIEMAKFAAVNATRLTEDASAERERARLYEGAALIVTEAFERGVEILDALDRDKLAEADISLLDAALSIADQVRRMPNAPDAEPPAAAGEAASRALAQARETISQVDGLLSGAR
jgi:chemotaxis protein MotC